MNQEHLAEPRENPGADLTMAGDYLLENLLQDSVLAEYIAFGNVEGTTKVSPIDPLNAELRWVPDWGWMQWSGKVWGKVPEPVAIDMVRMYLKALFMGAMSQNASPRTNNLFKVLLQRNKAQSVTFFLKGILTTEAKEFDQHLDQVPKRDRGPANRPD
jgi:hypothetical protein